MDSVIKTGLAGVRTGTENAVRSAERVTRAFSPNSGENVVDPMVDLKLAENQVQASAKVIRIGDEMLGQILDIIG